MGPEPDPTSDVPGMAIWGWMSPAELRWLGARASEMTSVAEIGVNRGRSSFALATGCDGPVYSVELWDDPGDHGYRAFMENVGYLPNVTPVRGRSPGIASEVPDVDMVFIDGDHEYDSVVADIRGWLPKTRRLLCGHDYNVDGDASYPGVAKAVHDTVGVPLVAPDTAIWYVEL